MSAETFAEALLRILPLDEGGLYDEEYRSERSGVERIDEDGTIHLKFGDMYEAPPFDVDRLFALCDLFGTKSVDVDNYGIGGCESCDFGSDYGHTIQVRNPTKNIEEARAYMSDHPVKETL